MVVDDDVARLGQVTPVNRDVAAHHQTDPELAPPCEKTLVPDGRLVPSVSELLAQSGLDQTAGEHLPARQTDGVGELARPDHAIAIHMRRIRARISAARGPPVRSANLEFTAGCRSVAHSRARGGAGMP
jgi:hypothetical protein